LTNLQAAVGLAQFERIDEFVEMRRRNARQYKKSLSGISGIRLPIEKMWAKNVHWMFSILVDSNFKVDRDTIIYKLKKRGIETRPFFVPMNQQPVFRNKALFEGENYPVSEDISCKGLYLPSSSGLADQEIELVCDSIKNIANGLY
jgi:perosamine synthetase